ncbi:MAG: alpha-L-fucosidase [Kiritimatiellae bacterium]|nr:alpha-L-fucosidase [Kiritimatiellia bacterium]
MATPLRAMVIAALALGGSPTPGGADDAREAFRREFLTWRFGMFIHFDIATFNEREWSNGYEDPTSFAPTNLDCGQWADAARTAGMRYAVLTVKHTGGWCLWPTALTRSHGATALRNFRDGRGDLVREFVEAFRARGLKVGFYYCFPGNYTGRCGNPPLAAGQRDLCGLPPEAAGDFLGFIRAQLTELLTGYGPVDLLWIDQYRNRYTGAQWPELLAHIRRLQPGCVVVANNARNFADSDIHSYEYPWARHADPAHALPPPTNTAAAEVSDKLGPGWFWSSRETAQTIQTPEQVVEMVRLCNSRRANYLLNVAPDRTGRIPEYSVQCLRRIGELLRDSPR